MIAASLRLTERHGGVLAVMLLVVAAFILLPGLGFLSLFGFGGSLAFSPTQLHAIRETALLMAGVGLFSLFFGVSAAWLVTVHEFPGRRALDVMLILPLAFPTYLAAFVAVDLMHFFGPVQGAYRWLTGAKSARDYWFPEMRSLGGAIVVLGLVLFPYVYVPCRIVFSRSGRNMIDAARLLGAGGWGLFFRVGLPIARPAMIGGVVLALLEALNDIGATEYLGVSSLSVVIRDFWANRGDLAAATRMAGVLALVMLILLLLDPAMRGGRGRRPAAARGGRANPSRIRLQGLSGLAATAFCALPVTAGFLIPTGFLVAMLWRYSLTREVDPALLEAAMTTLVVAGLVSLIVMIAGAILAIGVRILPKLGRLRLLTMLGYATPGTVLALAVLPVIRVGDSLFGWMGLALTATTFVVLYALSIRFLGIATGQAHIALQRLPMNVDAVARIHGLHDLGLAMRVHLPTLAPGLLLGGVLVFIDTVKELSATVLLRPLNLETLATRAYALASVGQFEQAAVESLLIVLLSGLATWIVARRA